MATAEAGNFTILNTQNTTGGFTIHAAGCRDIKRTVTTRKGQEIETIEATSKAEVVDNVLGYYCGEVDSVEVDFAPCCKLK